jgi:hypothetical protein
MIWSDLYPAIGFAPYFAKIQASGTDAGQVWTCARGKREPAL